MCIMLVDSNKESLERLYECVQGLHKEEDIVTFRNPMLAAKHGYDHPPSLLYTATNMRGMTGFDLVRFLRVGNLTMQSFIIGESEMERKLAMQIGADAFLIKPITLEGLRMAEAEFSDFV